MPKQLKTPIKFKNLSHDARGHFVGYLKGKRKKYVEQTERYATPAEAMAALGLKPSNASGV